MATRPTDGAPTSEVEALRKLAQLLQRAGFRVQDEPRVKNVVFDLLAVQDELGRPRRHYIELKHPNRFMRPSAVADQMARLVGLPAEHSYWLVAGGFSVGAMNLAAASPRLRLFTWQELQRLLKPPPRRTAKPRIVPAIVAHKREIVVMAAGLGRLLNERIEAINRQRPNSPEAIEAQSKALSDYESLRQRVTELQTVVEAFEPSAAKKEEVKKTVGAFQKGFEKWISGGHNFAFSSSFGMGLFLVGTALSSMLGVPMVESAYLSAALAGGPSIGGVIKAIVKN